MNYIGPLLLQLILIALNAMFAAAEAAFLSINSARIEKIIEDGNKKTRKKARRLQRLTKDSSKFLSTIQVAITLAGFLGSAFAADSFAGDLQRWFNGLNLVVGEVKIQLPESVFVVLITLLLSFFSIVLGELIPKKLAIKHAEGYSLWISGFISVFAGICAPFVWILTKATNGLLRLFGVNPNEEDEVASEEEIRIMLDTSSEKGAIDTMENEMIQNIFEFDDISISEVCTHRRDVAMLYREDDLDAWKEKISHSRHGYYPICGEDADDIVGILSIKKFFRAECKSVEEAIAVAAEKPYFVPENMKADVLFSNMKETRNYFAIVVDEYGGTSGVITIHDLLELLVGDMGDKEDVIVEEIVKTGENSFTVLGAASLEKVAAELGVSFEEEECDTFGGYIFGLLGEIPDDGTQPELETEEMIIKVESVVDHRIESTSVTVKEKSVDEDDEDYDEDEDEDDESGKKKRKKRDKDEDDESSEDEKSNKKEKNTEEKDD